MISTKERLAQALHAAGLFDLEKRARAGEFSDFESEHATPQMELVHALQTRGQAAHAFAARVMDGEFDDTTEEAEAWYQREGKDLLK